MSKRTKIFGKLAAFTLAEVLITLGIVGVVAALTMPVLIQKYQEQAYITGAKRFYNLISRAVQLAVLDNGLPQNWDLLSSPENMIKPLMPYLKIAKHCNITNGQVCYNQTIYLRNKNKMGNIFSGSNAKRSSFILNDGTVVSVFAQSANCNHLGRGFCGEYMIDVNGEKAPNTYGKDIFIFNLTKNGQVAPNGTPDCTSSTCGDDSEKSYYDFERGCLDKNSSGFGCSGWVVINGNMDYWHCDDLSWSGKHKCN